MEKPLHELSIAEAGRALRAGSLTCLALTEHALARIARHIPLVALSNASNDQIAANVAKLGAPFHATFTAESARAYKPRLQAFEYMFDQLGCSPADVLHVSSSLRYDLIPAYMLRIGARAWVARGHDFPNPYFGYTEIKDIGGLPALVGL